MTKRLSTPAALALLGERLSAWGFSLAAQETPASPSLPRSATWHRACRLGTLVVWADASSKASVEMRIAVGLRLPGLESLLDEVTHELPHRDRLRTEWERRFALGWSIGAGTPTPDAVSFAGRNTALQFEFSGTRSRAPLEAALAVLEEGVRAFAAYGETGLDRSAVADPNRLADGGPSLLSALILESVLGNEAGVARMLSGDDDRVRILPGMAAPLARRLGPASLRCYRERLGAELAPTA